MRILLNFVPLKSGGGVQVGLDFLRQVQANGGEHRWDVVATAGTPVARVPQGPHLRVAKLLPNDAVSRAAFERFGCKELLAELKPDVIYTQFGGPWPGAKSIPNVIGCAYANLMYPEMKFWDKYPLPQRLLRTVKDGYRKRALYSADHVVFENEDLAHRAVTLLGLDPGRVHVVRPAPSSLVAEDGPGHEETVAVCRSLPPGFKVLLISGYQRNKNFEILPKVALCLKQAFRIDDVVFLTTLPSNHPGTRRYLDAAGRLGVQSMIMNIGSVAQEGCATLYRHVDAVLLPSRLESFSNTIAEAWAMRRPLLISDMDWARSICSDGAIYVRHDDARHVAERILEVRSSADLRAAAVTGGAEALKRYSTPRQRFLQYLDIIRASAVAG